MDLRLLLSLSSDTSDHETETQRRSRKPCHAVVRNSQHAKNFAFCLLLIGERTPGRGLPKTKADQHFLFVKLRDYICALISSSSSKSAAL